MSNKLPQSAGLHRLTTAEGRHITLTIPEGYDGREPAPLVVSLHYSGQVTPFYGQDLLAGVVEPALRRLGAVMVAPDCGHGRWDTEQSEVEVLALVDSLAERYRLDRAKAILTGYSLGGMGTWYIAGRNQDRFAAALPMAAHPPEGVMDQSWRIPVYAIHGREDEVIPWQTAAEGVNRLLEQGATAEFVLLEGVTHYETGRFMRPLQGSIPWIRRVWGDGGTR